MPSAKHNLTMDKATGLIFHCSTSLRPEMCLFANHSTYNACMYNGLTFVLLCAPVLFAYNARYRFAIVRYNFPLVVL